MHWLERPCSSAGLSQELSHAALHLPFAGGFRRDLPVFRQPEVDMLAIRLAVVALLGAQAIGVPLADYHTHLKDGL